MRLEVDFPPKLTFLFKPSRYKVAHGGRGSGKSWAFARALIIKAYQKPIRVLCGREVQKSIKDSVHRLLSDQIQEMGLGFAFEVLESEIRGRNGSLFLFAGLAQHTVESIKSFEGVDVCWLEEAQVISKRSYDVLLPTIRKDGSEVWISFNPDMETDETYQRFVANPPGNAIVEQVNWRDNPWFPPVLEAERLETLRRDPENYENIWEGKPKRVAEGAIYAAEIDRAYQENRVRLVPYDPLLSVHWVFDLGWNDSMVIGAFQRRASEIACIDYIEDSFRTLDYYIAEIEKKPYRVGTYFIPHDGRSRDFKTGKSTQEILEGMGKTVVVLPQMSIEEGIKATRMMFPRVYFDKEKTDKLLEHLKRYRRTINLRTNEPGAPLHDEHSHACLVAGTMITTARGSVPIESVVVGDYVLTPVGYSLVSNSGMTKIATELIEVTTESGVVITMTPEHKIFTIDGVVRADALSYNSNLIDYESSPCLSFQKIKSVGYRGAFIESFKDQGIGFGKLAEFMGHKLVEFKDFCILRYTEPFMAILKSRQRSHAWMGTSATPAPITGSLSERQMQESTPFKKLTEFASTTSQRDTTKQTTRGMAASPCTDMYGSSTTGRFQTVCTSITKMATKAITPLKTLNCFLHQSIWATTQELVVGLEARKTKSSWFVPLKSQSNGIPVMKVESGTLRTQSTLGRIANGIQQIASNVGKSTQLLTRQGQSSATRIAKLRRYETEQPVYDLTVEHHHCYFANGLLVSNCDMFRYAAMAVDQMGNAETAKPISYKRRFLA